MTKPSEAALRAAHKISDGISTDPAFTKDQVAAIIDAEYDPVVKELVKASERSLRLIQTLATHPDICDELSAAIQRAKEIGG